MKAFLIFFALGIIAVPADAATKFCDRYDQQNTLVTAIDTVASELKYTHEELCNLDRLSDIYTQKTTRYDEENLPVDHVLVTLYYSSYACQYYVRNDDQIITGKNCYNTW